MPSFIHSFNSLYTCLFHLRFRFETTPEVLELSAEPSVFVCLLGKSRLRDYFLHLLHLLCCPASRQGFVQSPLDLEVRHNWGGTAPPQACDTVFCVCDICSAPLPTGKGVHSPLEREAVLEPCPRGPGHS